MISGLATDVRFALRSLGRSPAFAAVTFLTLALGIGSTSAMFSILDAVLLAPLPWGEPDRAIMIWSRWDAFDKTWVSDGEILDYRRRMTTARSIAGWSEGQVNVTGEGAPERVGQAQVTANVFDTLAAPPALGRPFTAEEDAPNGPRVAIISHDLWQRRYGGSASVLGRGIQLDGRGYEIVGVMPPGFSLPTDYAAAERTQVFVPLQIDSRTADHGGHGYYAAARLVTGATVDQATRELQAIARALTREGFYPETMQFSAFAVSLRDEVVGDVRPAVLAVFGAVGFLLLIACVNVANLMLIRSEARQRELAVRAALGASRARAARLLLTEGLVLSLAGGLAGLGLAVVTVRWIAWWNPAGIPRLAEADVDLAVALFALAVAVMSAVLFSVAPALHASRLDLTDQLKDGQNATIGGSRQRFRSALVVVEIALAVVLLVGAGLMLRSLDRLQRLDLGFDPANVLTLRVSVPEMEYESPLASVSFYREVISRVRALPGVTNAAAVRSLPLASTIGDFGVTIDGFAPPGVRPKADWQIATDGYLETLGEQLLRGRSLRASDDENGMLVGMINEEMARVYWNGQDPIGRRFRVGRNTERPWVTVVGIVRDVRHNGITGAVKEKFYIPHAQWHRSVGPMRSMYLVVRAQRDPEALAPAIRQEVRAIDPDVPIASVRTMEDVVDAALSQPRFTGVLFTIFAALALILASVGIYGVLSYVVSQRTREIGIRLAVGASPRLVGQQVLGRGVGLAVLGIVIGASASLVLGRAASALLYEVRPTDPATYLGGAIVLLSVAVAASCIPARRATMVDPVIALKAE